MESQVEEASGIGGPEPCQMSQSTPLIPLQVKSSLLSDQTDKNDATLSVPVNGFVNNMVLSDSDTEDPLSKLNAACEQFSKNGKEMDVHVNEHTENNQPQESNMNGDIHSTDECGVSSPSNIDTPEDTINYPDFLDVLNNKMNLVLNGTVDDSNNTDSDNTEIVNFLHSTDGNDTIQPSTREKLEDADTQEAISDKGVSPPLTASLDDRTSPSVNIASRQLSPASILDHDQLGELSSDQVTKPVPDHKVKEIVNSSEASNTSLSMVQDTPYDSNHMSQPAVASVNGQSEHNKASDASEELVGEHISSTKNMTRRSTGKVQNKIKSNKVIKETDAPKTNKPACGKSRILKPDGQTSIRRWLRMDKANSTSITKASNKDTKTRNKSTAVRKSKCTVSKNNTSDTSQNVSKNVKDSSNIISSCVKNSEKTNGPLRGESADVQLEPLVQQKPIPKARKSFHPVSRESKSEDRDTSSTKTIPVTNITFNVKEIENVLGMERKSLEKIHSKRFDDIMLKKIQSRRSVSPISDNSTSTTGNISTVLASQKLLNRRKRKRKLGTYSLPGQKKSAKKKKMMSNAEEEILTSESMLLKTDDISSDTEKVAAIQEQRIPPLCEDVLMTEQIELPEFVDPSTCDNTAKDKRVKKAKKKLWSRGFASKHTKKKRRHRKSKKKLYMIDSTTDTSLICTIKQVSH